MSSSTQHFGIISDNCVYTTKQLALIIGWKQARTAENNCDLIGCRVKHLGAKALVTGYEFRIALEAFEGELIDE